METVRFRVGKNESEVIGYIHENLQEYCKAGSYKNRPAVVVCPGGGYHNLSHREADPIALPIFAAGYNVFIARYSVTPELLKNEEPEIELGLAISTIKAHSEEWNTESDKIAIMGFSAGGHAAASLLCHWQNYSEAFKPSLGILCYPVITVRGDYTHAETASNITHNHDERREKYYNLNDEVTELTPPCFIWHTYEDQSVNVRNSLLFASSLIDHKVPCELHIFEKGSHGSACGYRETGLPIKGVQAWMDLCLAWLNERFSFER